MKFVYVFVHVICPYRVFNKYDFIRINDEVSSNGFVLLNFYHYIYYVCIRYKITKPSYSNDSFQKKNYSGRNIKD